jgi:diadenosine tetraphosphate (Ap4A) HIT family hydrolase
MNFSLDPRLAADTLEIGELGLSRLLLMNDARFLWLVLVPRIDNLTEIVDLDVGDRSRLMDEIAACSLWLRARAGVDKVNVGALGNIVRQLHVHVIGRATGDDAWPGPVWGAGAGRRYDSDAAAALAEDIRQAFVDDFLRSAP